MNRRQRRSQASTARRAGVEDPAPLGEGYRWKQRQDPEDENYTIIEVRIPTRPGTPGASYAGRAAAERLATFCQSFAEGIVGEGEFQG